MPIKTILVGLTDRQSLGALRAAVDFAGRTDARVMGFASRYVPAVLAAESSGMLYAAEQVAGERELVALEATYVAEVPARLQAGWRGAIDIPDRGLAIEARSADLVVVEASEAGLGHYDMGALVLNAGRPVLLLADGSTEIKSNRIVVGWKDTREARRAVSDSLPFLLKATDIVLAGINEGHGVDETGLRDVHAYLARHGVESRVETSMVPADNAGHRLREIATEENADMIVAGAYGHSRLREWAFGGVTRSLLKDRSITYLLSS